MSIEMLSNIHVEKGLEEYYLDLIGRKSLEVDPKPAIILYGDVDMNVIDGSSVWLASTAEAFTSCGFEVHLLLKSNIERDMLVGHLGDLPDITIIEPNQFGIQEGQLSVKDAISLVEILDGIYGGYKGIVLRGLNLCAQASGAKSLHKRIWGYLTDYYEIDSITGRSGKENVDELICDFRHVFDRFLVQTEEMKQNLITEYGVEEELLSIFPPMVPQFKIATNQESENGALKIGYCGKIAPLWGVRELIELVAPLIDAGKNIEVHVIGDKIHKNTPENPRFLEDMMSILSETGYVIWHGAQTREAAMNLMSSMDIAWCYRSVELELETLELSTKLLENMSMGLPIILTRNGIHEQLLGEDYPLFVDNISQIGSVLERASEPTELQKIDFEKYRKIASSHSINNVREEIVKPLLSKIVVLPSDKVKRIVINGHDLKFIGEFESHLKQIGHIVRRDLWEWADPIDERRSLCLVRWGDIIFSEWGLGNAVWYSNNINSKHHHVIRIHLQEINERARRFPIEIDVANVDEIIVVAEHVRETAEKLFSWKKVKNSTVPNFVDVDRLLGEKLPSAEKTLGIAGIVPQRKRFDRALDVLKKLRAEDPEWRLIVKGKQPKDIPFMHGPSRKEELVWYENQYYRLDDDPELEGAVIFEGYTTTISSWYRKIGYMLSPSDFESFHFSIADGVASGAFPVVWPWEGAKDIYPKSWIVKDTDEAAKVILNHSRSKRRNKDGQRRQFIKENYGLESVFERMRNAMGLE
jgi:glycosyltransferase involved in cell wall biosynthesis